MKKYYWPLVLYVSVVLLVFGRAIVPSAGEMIWGDDIHRQYYFYRQFFNSFLRDGIWPWWNPYIFGGAPFIANPVVNIWYPPTWLFVILPINVAYSWHIALHIFWAMMGMYVFMSSRDRSDRVPPKALAVAHGAAIPMGLLRLRQLADPRNDVFIGPWVGGLVFGLSGFFAARIWAGHADMIAAASYLPWVVWSNIRCQLSSVQTWKKHCVASAVFFALQLLSGYQTMAMMTVIAVGIVTLLHCYTAKSFQPLFRGALAGLLGLGLAGIQIVPLQEFFRASIRTFDFGYSWNSYGSLTIASLKQFFNPFIFGDQLTYHGPPPNYAEHAFFAGRMGVLLIFGFLLFRLPRLLTSPRLLTFLFLAVFGLWVSLGPNAPVDLQYLLWKTVPMYRYLRFPPRHLVLVAFAVAGLVGLSMNFAAEALGRILKQYKGSVMVCLAIVISLEMMFYARHFIAVKPAPESRHDAGLLKILAQDREPYRVLTNFGVWVPARDSFDFDAGMNYRVFNATGYDPSILRSYYEYIDMANGNTPGASILDHDVQIPYLNVYSRATDFLNIKYILHPRAYDPLYGTVDGRFRLVREDRVRDWRLYENTAVKPRFFFDGAGRVSITRYSPNEIVLTADTPSGDMLQSSEVFYPGWEGYVDGKKTDIIKSNHAFRSLFVPAGNHTVIYRFNPRIFVIAALVSAVSVGLAFFLLNLRSFPGP